MCLLPNVCNRKRGPSQFFDLLSKWLRILLKSEGHVPGSWQDGAQCQLLVSGFGAPSPASQLCDPHWVSLPLGASVSVLKHGVTTV